MPADRLRHSQQRRALAARLWQLKSWPMGWNAARRGLTQRRLGQAYDGASLELLLRRAITEVHYADQREPAFVEVHESAAAVATPAMPLLSELLATAETQGFDAGRICVHQETYIEPYEGWEHDILVLSDSVPESDEDYAARIEGVWQEYQTFLLRTEQDLADYAQYLVLHARFGPRS